MNRYHYETLTFVLALSLNAGADGIKPQVSGGVVNPLPTNQAVMTFAPQPAGQQPLPTGAVPSESMIPGTNVPTNVMNPNPQNDEATALMNAFGQILPSLFGGSGGRSEFANSSGNSGIDYSHSSSLTPISASDLNGTRKIMAPFRKWFDTCTKNLGLGDCRFENLGVMGDAAHRARASCHNSGEAIDVGAVTCSGGQKLVTSSSQFFNLANCMANNSNDELQVIFYKATGPNMIQKLDHTGHMHIQLKNCHMVYGQ